MEAVLTGISGMFVYFLLCALWLSSLRGGRSCVGCHGLGSRLGGLGLLVFSFLLLGFDEMQKMIEQNLKPETSPTGLLGLTLAL